MILIFFVFFDNFLIICIDRKIDFVDCLLIKYGDYLNLFEKIIMYILLDIYIYYVKELREMKYRIDVLDKVVCKMMENEELYK